LARATKCNNYYGAYCKAPADHPCESNLGLNRFTRRAPLDNFLANIARARFLLFTACASRLRWAPAPSLGAAPVTGSGAGPRNLEVPGSAGNRSIERGAEMPKSIALLALTLLFVSTGVAQEQKRSACRFRFAVAERIGHDRWGVWPEDARKWWSEEGKKKFPELCETTSQDADFVIAWLRKQSTETHTRPKRDETWIYGPFPTLPANDCYTIPGQTTCYTGLDGQTICETSPSQTICTPQPVALPEWEAYETSVERISVTAYRVSKDHFERVASVTKAGYFPTDRPGRASFRSAMKALKKKSQQAAASRMKRGLH